MLKNKNRIQQQSLSKLNKYFLHPNFPQTSPRPKFSLFNISILVYSVFTITGNCLQEYKIEPEPMNLSRDQLIELLNAATKNQLFQFNGNL